MKPTNKMRWLFKDTYSPPVLQQWWNEVDIFGVEVKGIWRDVPTEAEL